MKHHFLPKLALLFIAFLSGAAYAQDLPTVALFTTGGTIQSKGAHRQKLMEYGEGRVTPAELLADLPELKDIAIMEVHEISNVGSGSIGADHHLRLAKQITETLARDDISGAVVTHGTTTLEETAYFLQLTVKSEKPVIVVGAMRPFTAASRDGPFNLYNATRVAIEPTAVGKGVMIVLNDTIHSARFATKGHTYHVETFDSRDIGPIGYTDSDRVVFYRTPLVRHTANSEFDVMDLDELPKVDIVYGYQEASAAPIPALVEDGIDGLVLSSGSRNFGGEIKKAQAAGIIVVNSDRKGAGRVVLSDRRFSSGYITADNLNPQKSRILLRLALTKTSSLKEIQRIFNEY
ncbi:type II asparaginase [Pelagicoccus sp. SDUM812003]|uniref:type II asparaginase n=1 Tax=Pelagicoccus sp. SDUM812003 TaxID=3041267 RepID=UPI00280D0748|nr:type II asparaginase [Pelagicoccus sp. SDUM812003]MDQ8204686.1 type II asparaginase [Pelagicoccus sp. SDUM812003]